MPKDVLGSSAAANVLGARKRTEAAGEKAPTPAKKTTAKKTAAKRTAKKTAAKKTAARKASAKTTGKKTTKKQTETIDLAGAGDELLAAIPSAKVASGSTRRVKLQPELHVRLTRLADPFGDLRDPRSPREKLVSPGKLASVATDALLAAHGEELLELARAAGRESIDVSGILTVGTHADGEPHPDAPRVPWVRLAETTWARLTALSSEASRVRDSQGRRAITAEAIVNEAVARWLAANEERWLARGRELQ